MYRSGSSSDRNKQDGVLTLNVTSSALSVVNESKLVLVYAFH